MKRFVKLIATLLLVISLIVNAVSCDLLLPFIEDSLGGEQSGVKPDGGSTEEDNDNDSEGDEEKEAEFYIKGDSSYDLTVGDMKALSVKKSSWLEGEIVWVTSNSCVAVENGVIIAREEGAGYVAITEPASDSKEPERDGNISLAVVLDGGKVAADIDSHIVVTKKIKAGEKVVMLNGSGWSQGGVASHEEWCRQVAQATEALNNPLSVIIK